MITVNRTINLHPNEKVQLLFKFFTDGERPEAYQNRIISVKILEKDGPLVSEFNL